MFQLGGSTTNDFLFIQNSYYVVPEMFPRINDAVDEIFLKHYFIVSQAPLFRRLKPHRSQVFSPQTILPGIGQLPPLPGNAWQIAAKWELWGSFKMLWRYGFQPQRTALRIYWNALKLLRPFVEKSDFFRCGLPQVPKKRHEPWRVELYDNKLTTYMGLGMLQKNHPNWH